MSAKKFDPTTTENLSMRGVPRWAADAIRAHADKFGVSYTDQVRIILVDAALRYERRTARAAVPQEA